MMYTILIADDERMERTGLSYLIHSHELPLSVLEAANGEEAWDILSTRQVDILLTDIKMPFLDGLQLAARVKERFPDVKTILLSAFGEFDYAQRAIRAQVLNYLLKPVDVDEFLSVMGTAIRMCQDEEEGDDGGGEDSRTPFCAAPSPLTPLHAPQPTTGNEEPHRAAIRQVMDIIRAEYASDVNLEYLAGRVYLAPSYLSALFKRETGSSLIKWLTQFRMERACALLTGTNLRINDIAAQVGYENLSYFCALFRNQYGISPARFREEG